MLRSWTDLLLAFGVEIYATNTSLLLVEANVVKPLKAGTVDRGDTMIGHQKVFLPAHEDVLALGKVGYCYSNTLTHLLAVLPKGRELAPVI